MPKRFFQKESISNPILDRKGKVIPFESLAQDMGVIALDTTSQADLIADLEDYAKRQVGGVVPLSSEAEYDDLKKKLPWQPSASPSEQLRVMAPVFQPKAPPVAAAVDSGAPIDPFAPKVMLENAEPSLAQRTSESPGAAAFRLRTGKPTKVSKPSPTP